MALNGFMLHKSLLKNVHNLLNSYTYASVLNNTFCCNLIFVFISFITFDFLCNSLGLWKIDISKSYSYESVLLNTVLGHCIILYFISFLTLEFLSKALAMHINCLSPTLKLEPPSNTGASSCSAKVDIWNEWGKTHNQAQLNVRVYFKATNMFWLTVKQ